MALRPGDRNPLVWSIGGEHLRGEFRVIIGRLSDARYSAYLLPEN